MNFFSKQKIFLSFTRLSFYINVFKSLMFFLGHLLKHSQPWAPLLCWMSRINISSKVILLNIILLLKLSQKTSSFVSGNWPGEKCFITHPPAKSNMYQNKYFQFKNKLKTKREQLDLKGLRWRRLLLLDRVLNFSWLFIWI